jgi:hypothetical protein
MTPSPKTGEGSFGAGVVLDAIELYKEKFKEYFKQLITIERASEETGRRIEQKLGVVAANAFGEIAERAKGYLDKIEGFGRQLFESAKSFVMSTVHAAAEHDDLFKQMEITFKERAPEIFHATEEAADNAGFAFKEAAGFVTMMGKQGVNALASVKNKAGEAITALESLDDLAAFSGQSLDKMGTLMRKAFGGSAKRAEKAIGRMFAHAPLDAFEKKFLKSGKTMQEKYERLAQLVQNKFGGISDVTDMAFNELNQNIDSTMHDLMAKLGKPLQDAIVPLLSEVWKFLKELKKNKELFEALGDIWKEIGIRVAQVAKYGLILARWLIKFITDHRELFKQMAIWTGYAVAIATVVAGLLSAVIGAGLFIATMKLMLPLIISAAASIATVVLWIGALIAIGAVLYRAYQDNWGGFKDLVDTVYWAVVGLFEIIKNWTDGTSEMSEKTAKNLKKMGIFEWVVDVGGWIGSLLDVVKKTFVYLASQWPRVVETFRIFGEPLQKLFHAIGGIVSDVADMFGLTNTQLDGTSRSTSIAHTIFEAFMRVLEVGVAIGATVIDVVAQMLEGIRNLGRIVKFVVSGQVSTGFSEMGGTAQKVGFAFRAVFEIFSNLYYLFVGVGKVIYYVIDALVKLNGTWNPKKMYEIVKNAKDNIGAIQWTTPDAPAQQLGQVPPTTAPPASSLMTARASQDAAAATSQAGAAALSYAAGAAGPASPDSVVDAVRDLHKEIANQKMDPRAFARAMVEAQEEETLRKHGEVSGRGAGA